jgi:hypothetical protein
MFHNVYNIQLNDVYIDWYIQYKHHSIVYYIQLIHINMFRREELNNNMDIQI